MTVHVDWHYGYSAGALLRLVALALRECIDDRALMDWRREQNECFRMLANAIERRASALHEEAYGTVSLLCGALLDTLRTLYGSGSIHPRADYLLCYLAAQQPDWLNTMKRRQHWLALVKAPAQGLVGIYGDPARGFAGGYKEAT